jgi:Thermophilic glucose-6-phosphate isomerase and related metalloenzymes
MDDVPEASSSAELLQEQYWYIDGTDAFPIPLPVDEFWAQVMSGAPSEPLVARVLETDGWLVTQYDIDGGTDHDELHPHGDELHYLVSGDLDLVLVADDGTPTTISMRPGTMANVPRGVWHRLQARAPSRGIAFTAGRGTQHRAIKGPADPEAASAP